MPNQCIEDAIFRGCRQFCERVRYAEGVKVDNVLYSASRVGWDPETGQIVEGGLREQLRRAFKHMKTVIEHAGAKIDGVVQLMSFFAGNGSDGPLMEDISALVEVQKEFFTTGTSCGTTVYVKHWALR